MELTWKIEDKDVEKINQLINKNKDKVLYKNRLEKNVNKKGIITDREKIWKSIIVCLLTSQQNSSADSPIAKFAASKPFPLELEICKSHSEKLEKFVSKELQNSRGIRFYDRIATLLNKNFENLEKTDWKIFEEISSTLNNKNLDLELQIKLERECAKKIQDNLKGFGPKQSRNLLQILGLTVYEIPIDSRITRWLKEFDFPITISATALQDLNFYNFVSDAIQILCEKANVKPCLFDAAVFNEGDSGEWTLENLIY